jgi:hypothetical protein
MVMEFQKYKHGSYGTRVYIAITNVISCLFPLLYSSEIKIFKYNDTNARKE